jgi:hypothetical protein
MKKDLEFANTEVERLRAKLVFDNMDMPALSFEQFGSQKTKSTNYDVDGEGNLNSNHSDNIVSLKEAISQAS